VCAKPVDLMSGDPVGRCLEVEVPAVAGITPRNTPIEQVRQAWGAGSGVYGRGTFEVE
jgi:hypothetical protein